MESSDAASSLRRAIHWATATLASPAASVPVIGPFAAAIVSRELADGSCAIKTDKPQVKKSWQVARQREEAAADAERVAGTSHRGLRRFSARARAEVTVAVVVAAAALLDHVPVLLDQRSVNPEYPFAALSRQRAR